MVQTLGAGHVLGETVNPRNFNTLRRIQEEDNTVLEEQERFAELASSEALLKELQQELTAEKAREWFEELPDGIHSGLHRDRARGVFFYFTAPVRSGEGRQHFWRYYDFLTGQVLDNRLLIANYIKCQPHTPRFVPPGVDIFEVQERIIEDILETSQEQQAMEVAPKPINPIQQTIITALREYLNNPQYERQELRALMKLLGQPMPNVHVRALRNAYEEYGSSHEIQTVLDAIRAIQGNVGGREMEDEPVSTIIERDRLHLVCYDYVWS